MTVADVKSLVNAGISDDLIISQIRNSRTIYNLNTADIIELKNAGVSERVIDFMINTRTQMPTAEVAGIAGAAMPAPQTEVVYVAPGPDYVWVSGVWVWHTDLWIWHHGYWHRPVHPRYWR